MLYLVDITINYPAHCTHDEFLRIWAEETELALRGKASGAVVNIWKCVGENRVLVVLDVDSPRAVDLIMFRLPIMKKFGNTVDVTVTPLRDYEEFAADMQEYRD